MKTLVLIRLTSLVLNGFCLLLLSALVLGCSDDDDSNLDSFVSGAEVVDRLFDLTSAKSNETFDLLANDIEVIFKMNPDGSINDVVLSGFEAVRGQIEFLFNTFSEISYDQRRLTEANNGKTVFAQCILNTKITGTEAMFSNVILYRVELDEFGIIQSWEEYLNPVTNGEVLGIPLGSCQVQICQ